MFTFFSKIKIRFIGIILIACFSTKALSVNYTNNSASLLDELSGIWEAPNTHDYRIINFNYGIPYILYLDEDFKIKSFTKIQLLKTINDYNKVLYMVEDRTGEYIFSCTLYKNDVGKFLISMQHGYGMNILNYKSSYKQISEKYNQKINDFLFVRKFINNIEDQYQECEIIKNSNDEYILKIDKNKNPDLKLSVPDSKCDIYNFTAVCVIDDGALNKAQDISVVKLSLSHDDFFDIEFNFTFSQKYLKETNTIRGYSFCAESDNQEFN